VGWINVWGVRVGSRVQVVGTALKVGGLLTLMALPMIVGGADWHRLTPVWPSAPGGNVFLGIMAAMVAVLWAYDGWISLTPLAEEVREPSRNIPRAMIGGSLVLIALYLGTTLVYHLVLPLDEVIGLTQNAEGGVPSLIAAHYCQRLVGPAGVLAISMLVMASTFIALNGNALYGPRIYFAMARDGLFLSRVARIHPRFLTPANAILTQSIWGILLTLAGTAMILTPPPAPGGPLPAPIRAAWSELNRTPLYDLMFTYVIFGETIFYLLAVSSIFVLRARHPDVHRPYRTWGYPVTPAIYILASLLLAGSMLKQTPVESLAGLVIILIGLPVYRWFVRRPV
jgi:APA family basic amino acid/polyamine antiporter